MTKFDRTHIADGPLVGSSLADEIVFRLQTAILDGDLPPGTRLQQDELSARFGVSRTPLREALRILQTRGLVDHVPNRGATVRFPKRADVMDTYAIRGQLEGYACELAAARLRDTDIEAFDRAQEEMVRLVDKWHVGLSDSPEDLKLCQDIGAANARFHDVIRQAAANPRLTSLILDLQAMFPIDYLTKAITSPEEARRTYLEEHEEMKQALIDRDGKRAREIMVVHIESAGTRLLSYLDEQDFWETD